MTIKQKVQLEQNRQSFIESLIHEDLDKLLEGLVEAEQESKDSEWKLIYRMAICFVYDLIDRKNRNDD